MGLIPSMLFAIVHVLFILLDLAIIFLVVRIVRRWRTNRLIQTLDAAGTLLVDELSARVNAIWMGFFLCLQLP